MIASYDVDDYNRYTWSRARGLWELKDTPFTLDSLEKLYGEGFDPTLYDRDNPFNWNDTAYSFSLQDWNQSDYRDPHGIHKVYPDEEPPTILNLDSTRMYYPEELTEDGLGFKYYEYEYIARNLLPSQLHYIAVTAFDYGSPSTGLESLETPPDKNFVAEYPLATADTVETRGLNVIVYPNPYRADGQYNLLGEGQDYVIYNNYSDTLIRVEGFAQDRRRLIHFMNLPSKCKIRIFTLDGDLIREIDHNSSPGSPQSGHEEWDLITRNTQAIVSGIYYYSVESDVGNQIGKIIIIM